MAKRERIELQKLDIPVNFGLKFNLQEDTVTVKYSEDYEDEVFKDFFSFLRSLTNYYRRRLDITEKTKEQINLCNGFINALQGYKLDLRHNHKDKERFFKEIELHIEYFEYFKKQYSEQGGPKTSSKTIKETEYTLKQKVLIMEYLSLIKPIRQVSKTEKITGEVVASIIGGDNTNTIRAIRSLSGKPVKKGVEHTKTRANLELVRGFFREKKLPEIVKIIEEELNTIK